MRITTFKQIILASIGATMAFTVAANAQSAVPRKAVHGAWGQFAESGNKKACWISSDPTASSITLDGKPVEASRGDIHLFVSFRPSDGVIGEIGFTGGYPFKAGETVGLKVGESKYQLGVNGEWAWPTSASQDKKIIAALKAGADATLTGVSTRGKLTTDKFSLKGFTKAYGAAKADCGS